MNAWMWAAGAMLLCLIPCGAACLRGDVADRLVGLEAAGLIATLIFLLLGPAALVRRLGRRNPRWHEADRRT